MAIYLSFVGTWIALATFFPALQLFPASETSLWAVLLGGTVIFAVGVWDDIRGLVPEAKLLIEIAVAVGLFAAGIRIEGLGLLGPSEGLPVWLSFVLTTLWIVGVTNAFNLIDGSDGVAGGAALFASTALVIVLLLFDNVPGALAALTLSGAILGFLFFNFPPATIFLGDSGSLFIGFVLATLGVITTQTASTTLAVAIPVVSCGLPLLDTGLTMVRRFLRRDHILRADRGHIHHRLRDLGHSPRMIALLLYAASAVFALLSLLLVKPSTRAAATTVLLVAGAAVWLSIQRLHIPELLEVRRILQRGLQQRMVIGHNVRIREAVNQLRGAKTLESVTTALACAFAFGEFERAEVWIRADTSPAWPLPCGFLATRTGYQWSWNARPNGGRSDSLWEVQLPLRNERGRVVGRLSLWRSVDGPHLLTDIRLLALELQPEFYRALFRIHEVLTAPARVAPQPERTSHAHHSIHAGSA